MNEKEMMMAMNKLIYFNFNFPDYREMIKYIIDCDSEESWMYKHFKSKWLAMYENYGCRAVMLTFYCDLDYEYKIRMLDYILSNYKNEPKLF